MSVGSAGSLKAFHVSPEGSAESSRLSSILLGASSLRDTSTMFKALLAGQVSLRLAFGGLPLCSPPTSSKSVNPASLGRYLVAESTTTVSSSSEESLRIVVDLCKMATCQVKFPLTIPFCVSSPCDSCAVFL